MLGEGDTISERVRFDDNVSFIDADADYINADNRNTKSEIPGNEDVKKGENASEGTKNELAIKSNDSCIYNNPSEVSDDTIATPQRPIKVNISKWVCDMKCSLYATNFS